MTTRYTVPDGPKMLRETLCVAQAAVIRQVTDQGRRAEHVARIGRLITECDRHRPIGVDGKHGDRHTPTCGCDVSSLSELELVDAQPRGQWDRPCGNPSCPLIYAHAGPCAPCPFCEIVAGRGKANVVRSWLGGSRPVVAITPLNPVTPGHVLVIPGVHVADFSVDVEVTALAAGYAAILAAESPEDMNLITSRGPAATQTVHHLHIHLVPRRLGDDLPLPWTPQKDRP